jgi:hypothetical protein
MGKRDGKELLAKDDNDGGQVNELLVDVDDKLLAVDDDSEVNRPMSANGKGKVKEPLTFKRKVVANRQVKQSTQRYGASLGGPQNS